MTRAVEWSLQREWAYPKLIECAYIKLLPESTGSFCKTNKRKLTCVKKGKWVKNVYSHERVADEKIFEDHWMKLQIFFILRE